MIMSSSFQAHVDAGAANAEPSRDLSGAEFFPMAELANDCGIDLWLPALVHATCLCCGDAFRLAFLVKVHARKQPLRRARRTRVFVQPELDEI
jgi:hypothetical protein